MREFKVVVPETFEVISQQGGRVEIDLDQLSDETAAAAMLYGLKVKVQRSYSGAAAGAMAAGTSQVEFELMKMNHTLKNLYKGEWRQANRGTGFAATPLYRELRHYLEGIRGLKIAWGEVSKAIGGLPDMARVKPVLIEKVALPYRQHKEPTKTHTKKAAAETLDKLMAHAQSRVDDDNDLVIEI